MVRTLPIAFAVLGLTACAAGCSSSPRPPVDLVEAQGGGNDVPARFAPVQPQTPPEAPAPNRIADTLRVTLDRAVEIALTERPGVRAARARVLAAEAARGQARAWRNPEVGIEVEGFGGDRPGFDEAEITVGLAGGLDLLGRASALGRVADAELEAERAREEAAHRDLAALTRLDFHRVLAARERLRIAILALKVNRDTRDAILRQAEAGKTSQLRAIQAEATWEAARARHEAAVSRLSRAEGRFTRLLGGGAPGTGPVVTPTGRLRGLAPAPDSRPLTEELLSRHPEIVKEIRLAEAHHQRVRQLGRGRWPELDYSIGYRRDASQDLSDWVGGIAVELPLLDRSGDAIEEARRLESAAREEAGEAALRLHAELEAALSAREAAAALLERHDTEILPRAREILRLARVAYDEGKFGYLDLVNAQEAHARAEAERAEALIAHDRAITDLEVLLGRTLIASPDPLED